MLRAHSSQRQGITRLKYSNEDDEVVVKLIDTADDPALAPMEVNGADLTDLLQFLYLLPS